MRLEYHTRKHAPSRKGREKRDGDEEASRSHAKRLMTKVCCCPKNARKYIEENGIGHDGETIFPDRITKIEQIS